MKPSVIERLNSLRNFVGNTYSESDLSSCLRQAGYDVNLAANLLLTGDFKPSPTNAASSIFSLGKKRTSPSSDTSPKPSSSNHDQQTPSNRHSKKAKSNAATMSYTTPKSRQSAAVTPTTPAVTAAAAKDDDRWLLCQRWLSDGVCTQRNGSVAYQESLQIEASSTMIRFRGRNVQGQFPKRVSAFLAPLMDHIEVTASALMEERFLRIGSQIPFSLSVWLPCDPSLFFELFDTTKQGAASSLSSSSYTKTNGILSKSVKSSNATPKAKAAFALLQWAQLGDALEEFDPNASTLSDDEQASDDDNEEGLLLLEEEEEEEEQQADESEETKIALDLSSNNNNTSHCPEMDEPDHFGCQLRPYQKESLWWMIQREAEEENADFLRQQLQVLNDLANTTTTTTTSHESSSNGVQVVTPGISCDCGPVTIMATDGQHDNDEEDGIEAPPVQDNGTPADLDHPLWERRYLCSSDRTRALSFYVQPFFGVASASPPLPPKPCRGGLLCDSMGLGKTIQILALIQTSKQIDEQAGNDGPKTTLIVTPLSLLAQWEEEIRTKTNLTSSVYYGDSKDGVSFAMVDVVLTTYGTLQGEMRASFIARKPNSKTKTSQRNISGGGGGVLLSQAWKRIVLDEAHCIKNTSTVASRACCLLQAERRWCVSGTIIQNSLEDAYAQLKFLRHEPWHNHGFWNTAITRETDSNVALGRVQKVLAPIMIRRTKDSLDRHGKPILSLPPVETKTITVEFSEAERQFYDALFTKSLSLFEGFIQTGSVSKSWLAIFSLINRLRQTCDHVALTLKKHMGKDEWASRITASQRIKGEEETEQLEEENGKDIDSRFLNNIMDQFKAMQKDGRSSSQQSSFAQKVAERLNDAAQGKGELEECPLSLDPIDVESAVVTPCFHVFSRDGLMDVINTQKAKTKSVDFPCPVCNAQVSAPKVLSISKQDGEVQISYLHDPKPVVAPKTEEDPSGARQVLETAIGGSMGSKLAAISNELENVWDEDPGSKVLIFSQFLGFLDMMEHEFGNQGIATFRLDGSLSLKDRVKVIQEFGQSKKSSTPTNRTGSVLLISMKAGGVGLNLVAASSCFIADPWWNGAVEDQCINRIHRIGQTADKVRVRKFYVANTVEQRIVQLQEKKKRIANQIMAEGNSGTTDLSAGQPSLEDLKQLFQMG